MDGMHSFPICEVLIDEKCPTEVKVRHLNDFKGHVKKELVHEPSVPSYFECLGSMLRNWPREDKRVINLCHSTLCYLIKRVAMQAPSQFDDTIMPKLIRSLLWTLHEDKKLWSGSVKALETIYLAQPSIFESCLEQLCFDKEHRTATLLFVDELVQLHQKNNRNPMEVLNRFKPLFLSILNDTSATNMQPFELIHDILIKYYNKASLKEFSEGILSSETKKLFTEDQNKVFKDSDENNVQDTHSDAFDVSYELQEFLVEKTNSFGDVKPRDYGSLDYLEKDLEQLTTPFLSIKETEHNWKQRQENIIKLRSIIKGNATTQFPEELVILLKDLQVADCAAKAALSLRTTLSVQGCQLIKDMAHRFKGKLDPIFESLFIPMRNLLSATKKITSQNAFEAICVMLSYVQLHSRIFQQCLMLSRDKNVSPRCFAAVFLRIFIIRFHSKLEGSLVYIDEWVQRSLADAQTKVREAMRITFWYYYKMSASSAKRLLEGLSPQLKRAVELSLPKHLSLDYRPSQLSSLESSRRSSLGPRRTPSYAGSTLSHHIQRNAAMRSYSDIPPRSNAQSPLHTDLPNRVVSAHQNFIKKNNTHKPEIDVKSPEITTTSSSPVANAIIDLTAELTHNNSNTNTLIRKYIEDPNLDENELRQSQDEQNDMIKYLASSVLSENIHGLQLLRNILLVGIPIEYTNLHSQLRKIMIECPTGLKDLLHLKQFYDVLPLKYLIESLAINHIGFGQLLEKFQIDKIVKEVLSLFDDIYPSDKGLALHYVKYRPLIFDYCFDLIRNSIEETRESPTSVFETCAVKLLEIYGNEFDVTKYFDTIFQVYSSQPARFIAILAESPIFVRLKICRELEQRDSNFQPGPLLRREPSVDLPIEEDKNLLEMTMVNPSMISQRLSSTGSVLQNDIKDMASNNENTVEDAILNHHREDPGFTKFGGLSKLTEMTRVVSLYEQAETMSHVQLPQSIDEEGDIEMNHDDSIKTDVDLSDIFNQERTQRDATVKFDENPTIISQRSSQCFSNDLKGKNAEQSGEEHALNSPATILLETNRIESLSAVSVDVMSDKSLPAEHDSIDLLEGLNEMKLEKSGSTDNQITQNTHHETPKKNSFDIFACITKSSILEYELLLIKGPCQLEHPLEILIAKINKIKNGAFTMKDLNSIIEILLEAGNSQPTTEWIVLNGGFKELTFVSNLLLGSTDENNHIPANIVYKCIILSACLAIIVAQVPSLEFSSEIIDDLWEHIIRIITKLSDFANELYLVCEDLRDILLETGLFSSCQLVKFQSMMAKTKKTNVTKNTFLLKTSHLMLERIGHSLNTDLINSIVESAIDFASSEVTEWRKETISLLALCHSLLISRDAKLSHVFDQLTPSEFEMIKSLSTRTTQ